MGQTKRAWVGQAGQALLEYVLLILISMTLILGVVWKFNSAFHDYAYQLFRPDEGGYLFCLIQNAVLPGDDSCQSNLPRFDYASAKEKKLGGPPLTTNVNSSGAGAPPSTGSSSSNKNSAKNSSASSSGSKGTNEHETGTVATNSQDVKGSKSLTGSKSSNASNSSNSKSSKDKPLGGKGGFFEGGSGVDAPSASSDNLNSRSRFVGFEKSFSSSNIASQKIPTNENDLKSAREIANEKKKKKAASEDESPFTFGNFVKWIIIIALILLFVFFVGSQFVAVSRGNKR
jgi:hypothetical protein